MKLSEETSVSYSGALGSKSRPFTQAYLSRVFVMLRSPGNPEKTFNPPWTPPSKSFLIHNSQIITVVTKANDITVLRYREPVESLHASSASDTYFIAVLHIFLCKPSGRFPEVFRLTFCTNACYMARLSHTWFDHPNNIY